MPKTIVVTFTYSYEGELTDQQAIVEAERKAWLNEEIESGDLLSLIQSGDTDVSFTVQAI